MEVRVSDREWDFISSVLSHYPPKKSWHGRPHIADRDLFEGILWVFATGCRWQDVPKTYPSKSSCHKRFQHWCRDGSWLKLQQALVRRLKKKKVLDFKEGFIDSSLIKAKKGGFPSLKGENARALNLV